jgi:protein-S-isoprenylcysteine O-methyltransferase Ste14
MFLQVDKVLGFPKLFSPFLSLIIALPFLGAGFLLWLWSLLHFIRVKGTPVPFNPPPKLVATGPYAYARNPMLSGIFITLFGLGILLRSISVAFILTPLFVLLNAWELKAIEEPELERRLGKEYIEYRKKVPMFIPRWK